jgi:hypothetical protein
MKKSEVEKMESMGLGVSAGASGWGFGAKVDTAY